MIYEICISWFLAGAVIRGLEPICGNRSLPMFFLWDNLDHVMFLTVTHRDFIRLAKNVLDKFLQELKRVYDIPVDNLSLPLKKNFAFIRGYAFTYHFLLPCHKVLFYQ